MPGLLELSGSQAQRPVPWAPLFIEDLWPGLYTNRAALHDPSGLYERKYMGGRPGSLIGGLNTEISVRNTIIRRYGLSEFSMATYETPPNDAFSFQRLDGSIQVIVDTSSTGALAITSVGNAVGGTGQTTYVGTFPGGANDAYVGLLFMVTGFVTNLSNNSPTGFVCTASTNTTLTLSNPGGVAETHAATAISSGAVWIDNQDSTKTLLFAKTPGAGQTHFVAVAGILYMGDGVDTRKYTPGNLNGLLWNWGIAPPTAAPQLTVTESASAAATWVQLTVFSTMGLLLDGVGNVQSLISVNATGTNATQFGSTGNGQPAWNPAPGGTTTDGGVTWTNWGEIPAWTAHTLYINAGVGGGDAPSPTSQIYDPTSNTVQINGAGGFSSATSGASKPSFAAIQGSNLHDPPGGSTPPNVKWFSIFPPPGPWQASHAYGTFLGVNTANTCIIEPGTLPGSDASPVTLQICTTAGTSGSSGTQPPFPVLGVKNVQTRDNDLIWLSLGSATRANSAPYTAWSGQGSLFSVIVEGGRFYVATGTSGVSAGSAPSFAGTAYGDVVGDGSVSWTDAGPTIGWAAATSWYLPLQGFAPKSASQPYGGASITDSNGNLQTVIATGKSKANPHPVWQAAGVTTTDGTITWFNEGVANTNALVWKTSHTWAYSYKARSLTDFYTLPINGVVPVPPGILGPPYGTPPLVALPNPPKGSQTNAISTASPVSSLTSGNTGAVVTLKIPYSADPQVDTIIIWRDADGGGLDNMFELTEAPNIPALAGTPSGFAMVQDYFPDVPSTLNGVSYPGLNILIPAPIDGVNNPPDPTFLPEAYNFQRIWGPQGSEVNFSGGPDILTGNPNEAFSAADEFPYLSNVVRTVKSTLGLVVYTKNSIEIIEGGPLTASFNSVTLAAGVGLGNFNALDIFAGEQFFMDTTGQLRVLSPTLSLTSAGQPITDQLIQFDPTTAYIAFNEQPNDSAIYVGTGTAGFAGIGGSPTGWFRMNPRQVPGGTNGPEPVWSPFAEISHGCRMLQSIEVSPGIKKLLVGSNVSGQTIRKRDLTVFTDEFTPQPANPDSPGVDQALTAGSASSATTFSVGPLTPATTNEWALIVGTSSGSTTMSGGGWSAVSTPFMFGKFIGNSTAPFTASGTIGGGGSSWEAALLLFFTNGFAPVQVQTSPQGTLSGFDLTCTATFSTQNTTPGNSLIAFAYGAGSPPTPGTITATDTEGNTWGVVTNSNNGGRWVIVAVANDIAGGTLDGVTFSGFTGASTGFIQVTEFSGLANIPPTNLSQYDANFQIGNIWLAHRGEIAVTKFIEADFALVTTTPTVSYLLNEIGGTFTDFTTSIFDPPQIYGDLFNPTSYNPLRFYFSQTGSLARCIHMQVGVDFGTTPNADEIYNLTIYGQVVKGL